MIKKNFTPSKAIQKPRHFDAGVGFVTIVNSKKNGRRVEFRKEVIEKIGITKTIAVSYSEDTVIFFKPTDNSDTIIFNVSESNGKAVIYSYQLVEELTEFFGLDFDNRVCHTISDGGYDTFDEDGQPVLFVKRKSSNETICQPNTDNTIGSEVEANE